MISLNLTARKTFVAVATALFFAAPVAAAAEQVPSYASAQETIKGTITGFNGANTVYVHDDRGYVDTISLRQGTIINPTGIRLQEGMQVTIYGRNVGQSFEADRIDTPYPPSYYASPYGYGPNYGYGAYYGYGGYPYYGYGYPYYPYGGLYLGFGWGGWPWGWPGYYYGYPYRYGYPGYYRAPYYYPGHGTVGAPVHGGVSAPVRGGVGAHGGAHGGVSGGRPPR
jgi:hypothetical protein